jgi:thymidine kinase
MFAQKTTELLRRVRRYKSIGYKVLLVNFIGDNRYGKDCVASHDKDIEKAVCVSVLSEIDRMVSSGTYNVIAIDEGQFFPDLFEYVTNWADRLSVHIVVAGLDGNAKREPFGDMLRLVPHAEEVERLSAFCAVCRDGTVATYSKRMVEGLRPPTPPLQREPLLQGALLVREPLLQGAPLVRDPQNIVKGGGVWGGEAPPQQNQIVIGGADIYKPVCRKHFLYST